MASPVTPMFPLETALLPDEELPLQIFEPRYSALVTDCLDADDPVFGVVLIAAGREVGGGEERYDIGTLARIVEYVDIGGGRCRLRCRMADRIRVREWLPDDPYPRAVVEPWPDESGDMVTEGDIEVLEDRIMALFERIAAVQNVQLQPRELIFGGVALADDPGKKLYALATRVPMGPADRFSVLAAPTAAARRDALSEAIETASAMVDFQLSDD
jgi:Lon protease-like protein